MRVSFFLIALLFINLHSQAAEDRAIEGSCGDHWFKIDFKANTRTKAVTLSTSGDSGANASFNGTLVQEENDPSFKIEFNGPRKGYLYVDGTDYYHNIYWGTLSETGRPEDSVGLGLCSVLQ